VLNRLVYRSGRCSVCDEPIPTAELVNRQLCLTVLAPRGLAIIQCWIDRKCQPAPAAVSTFSRTLTSHVLSWYSTTVDSDASFVDIAHARS
jgi:hypothetical protein